MIICNDDDNYRFEVIYRSEFNDVNLFCDLTDVAWWKRPNLIATRYGLILPQYSSRMSLERIHQIYNNDTNRTSDTQQLTIRQIQSNDSGVYECETLGAIRQFNLTVLVRLTSVEFGAQTLSPYESTDDYLLNKSDHQSLTSNNGYIHLRENQLVRFTCVVSRAFPAVFLIFPFDIDYRVERNSTIENEDKTYRTILVLIIRVNRHIHKRSFYCEATQNHINHHDNRHEELRIRSNILQMDVAYGPVCSYKISLLSPYYAGIHRPINLTCHMKHGNPSKINFTWHFPNGNIRLGYYLNTTSSYITTIPETSTDFGKITCRGQNQLGLFGECHLNMILGGVPDPVESCHHTYLNSTLTVNCMAGFHQGDEDFFCYMYKRQANGSYSEHARLKGNCAFILPDLKPEYHHDFRVFTKNKYGDNFDRSYSIKVGKPRAESLADKTRLYWPYMTLLIIGTCLTTFILICCLFHKIRRTMSNNRKPKDDTRNLTYQNNNSHHSSHVDSNGKTSLVHAQHNDSEMSYPVRPFRSKDHLISSEPSTVYRSNPLTKGIYSNLDETLFNRRSLLKETDLDLINNPSNDQNEATIPMMKTLPLNRNRSHLSAYVSQQESDDQAPIINQRRFSFHEATKLDFYTLPEPFYFLNKQLLNQPPQRNHYLPEHDKHRDNNSNIKNDINGETSLVLENHMLTNNYLNVINSDSNSQWNEFERENFQTAQNSNSKKQTRYRDEGIFV